MWPHEPITRKCRDSNHYVFNTECSGPYKIQWHTSALTCIKIRQKLPKTYRKFSHSYDIGFKVRLMVSLVLQLGFMVTVTVISLWNSLPTHVITAVSVNSFKNRLDITAAPQVLNRVCLFPLPPLPFLPLPYPPIPSFPPFPSGVERSQSHLPPHSLSLPSLFPFPRGPTP